MIWAVFFRFIFSRILERYVRTVLGAELFDDLVYRRPRSQPHEHLVLTVGGRLGRGHLQGEVDRDLLGQGGRRGPEEVA
jgi:hypothetical protein